jgi:hypothetical protein
MEDQQEPVQVPESPGSILGKVLGSIAFEEVSWWYIWAVPLFGLEIIIPRASNPSPSTVHFRWFLC